jgi:hypothetical protein
MFQVKPEELTFRSLAIEEFQFISDWYHYAILEVTTLKGFQNEAEWIASHLGISVEQAKEKIKAFRREMSALLQRRGARDQVYQLSVSFFPVSKKSVNKTHSKENS